MLYQQSESYTINQLEDHAYEACANYKDDLHDISTRVVFDYNTYKITAAEAICHSLPFPICQQAMDKMSQLVGLQAGPGFARQVRNIVGGPQGCLHLAELVSKSMKNALYGSSRSIPEWTSEEDYRQRWAYWEKMFQNTCLYFSQPEALDGMIERVQQGKLGIIVD